MRGGCLNLAVHDAGRRELADRDAADRIRAAIERDVRVARATTTGEQAMPDASGDLERTFHEVVPNRPAGEVEWANDMGPVFALIGSDIRHIKIRPKHHTEHPGGIEFTPENSPTRFVIPLGSYLVRHEGGGYDVRRGDG